MTGLGEVGSRIVAIPLTDPMARELIEELNSELAGRYPEEGATHVRLDPEPVSPCGIRRDGTVRRVRRLAAQRVHGEVAGPMRTPAPGMPSAADGQSHTVIETTGT